MVKIKVGVYVFTQQIKERITKDRERYFDGKNYIGIRYILSQLDESLFEVSYVSKENYNSVDYCLVSMTSYYDELNLLSELYGKNITTRFIIGGAGFNNVALFRDIAWCGVVGRGEDIVRDILLGERPEGVYFRDTNHDLSKKLKIMPLRHFIDIKDKYLGDYCEQSIGCQNKCFFCEYSWKHKFTTKSKGYTSSIAPLETLFLDVDFSKYNHKDLVAAIDGTTEQTRRIINKPISNQQITDKFKEIYDCGQNYVSIKLYCLVGYPFEEKFEPESLIEAIYAARRESEVRATVLFSCPHFMPMPFTPMECEAVNLTDMREQIAKYGVEARYGHGNINVYFPPRMCSSFINALEATVINRADCDRIHDIKKVMCSSRYQSASKEQKKAAVLKYFGDLVGRVGSVYPYIERNNNSEGCKSRYLEQVRQLTSE